jgi:hypothetical protein
MIDTYQNCLIPIDEWVQMILHAHFFFELWEAFIDIGGYAKKKHFLSPQCIKITKVLIRGVTVHRDRGSK